MKTLILIISSLILLYAFTINNEDLELDSYKIIKKIDNIEIREYQNLIYTSYTPINEKDRNNSFRNVASYIFGENHSNQKINMTSPVVIKLHNKNEMAFIMPKEYNLNNLPKPNNKNLKIYEEPSCIKAAIKYSGYSNEKVEAKKIKELSYILEKNKIEHKKNFEVLVYNSPWKIFNRKNEIVVELNFKKKMNSNINKIYLGGGCFWCIEAVFKGIIGVEKVVSGYAGGKIKNPSYKEVSRGLTEHAEVCEISYNNDIISLKEIIKIFFLVHDPTTLNRQGNDVGKHYRSIILFNNQSEKKIIEQHIQEINKSLFDNNITTETKEIKNFYIAEEYHQNYYFENKNEPYCKYVITPKLSKARKELSKYYK
tara:strand:- start:1463 stop:2569 length:1107 start_codon:yes stop_codon:yes gene_type:complete